MNEKRLQIIDAAVKCFAQKGFHATSIQEIADVAGIAKGSLYFYFKSKEELLMSGFQYYFDSGKSKIVSVAEDESLSPKERLSKQVLMQFMLISDHRDFIMMLLNEQMIQINDHMKEFFFTIRSYTLYWFYSQIVEVYGEETKLYAIDGATFLKAIINEYMTYMIMDQKQFNLKELSDFILTRLDDVMHGMITKKQKPILTTDNMQHFMVKGKESFDQTTRTLIDELKNIRVLVEEAMIDSNIREEVIACLEALKEEFTKDKPRSVILKSILSYIRSKSIIGTEENLDAIEGMLLSQF